MTFCQKVPGFLTHWAFYAFLFFILLLASTILGGFSGWYMSQDISRETADGLREGIQEQVLNPETWEDGGRELTVKFVEGEDADAYEGRIEKLHADYDKWELAKGKDAENTAHYHGLLGGAIATGVAAPLVPAIYFQYTKNREDHGKWHWKTIGRWVGMYLLFVMLVGSLAAFSYFWFSNLADKTSLGIIAFCALVSLVPSAYGVWVIIRGEYFIPFCGKKDDAQKPLLEYEIGKGTGIEASGNPYGQDHPSGNPYGQDHPSGNPYGQDHLHDRPESSYLHGPPSGNPYGQDHPQSDPESSDSERRSQSDPESSDSERRPANRSKEASSSVSRRRLVTLEQLQECITTVKPIKT